MLERLKAIQQRILEWWNRFTTKQKSIIIGLVVVAVLTLAIIVYFASRPQYVRLQDCSTTKEASEVVAILQSNNIEYKTSSDGLRIDVITGQQALANLALGAAGYVADAYSPESALSGGLTTTASDKEKLWGVYLEERLASDFAALSNVKSAKVRLHLESQTGTLIERRAEHSAFVQLELDGTFTSANAQAMARAIQSALGNETTDEITIMDQDANLLFAGGQSNSTSGIASSMMELQQQAENMLTAQLRRVLIGTNQFSTVEVTGHLNVDYATYEETVKKYYANDGRDEGMKANERHYESQNESDIGGVPGATSNDGTVMVNPDASNSASSQTESEINYLPNEDIKYIVNPGGTIDYATSSLAIAMITYKEIRQEDVKLQGLLDGITWEEYKLANSDDVKVEVDPELYSMASTATGIPAENITIMSYETPLFYDKPSINVNWNVILSLVMMVVIFGLLAFVVLRTMRVKNEEVEIEQEELSVETLLKSTPESELEDIDVENKSETRKMIEKFVDENPESAAALLRNWLNADWE